MPAAAETEDAAELLLKAKQIKEELESKKVELNSNQRKKARRKLAKLFQPQDLASNPSCSTGAGTSTCSVLDMGPPSYIETSTTSFNAPQANNASVSEPAAARNNTGSIGPLSTSSLSTGGLAQLGGGAAKPALSAKEKRIPRWRLQKMAAKGIFPPGVLPLLGEGSVCGASEEVVQVCAKELQRGAGHGLAAAVTEAYSCDGEADCRDGSGCEAAGLVEESNPPHLEMKSSEGKGEEEKVSKRKREICRVDLSHEISIISSELSHSFGGPKDDGVEVQAGTQQQEQQQQQQDTTEGKGQEQGPSKKKKDKHELFTNGNYHGYYGYRLGHGDECVAHYYEDARLKLFQACWFEGRDVLDVGCNEGVITIELPPSFPPTICLAACRNLQQMRTMVQKELSSSDGSSMAGRWAEVRKAAKALKSTKFVHEDWSMSPHQRRKEYGGGGRSRIGRRSFGTVMCLSVTKWVHLNGGDDALRALFCKFWESLEPGFQLRPEQFISYLTTQLGFVLVSSLNRGSKGFDRPMFVLQRPEAEKAE
eukprot:gene16496-22723_t